MDPEETLGELIESNFLLCPVCCEHFESPCLLPCLHSICQRCAENFPREITIIPNKDGDSVTQSSKSDDDDVDTVAFINCPVCYSAVGVPQDSLFPPDPFMHSMCQMYAYKHQTQRSCDYCRFDNKTVSASYLCLECKDDMCNNCAEAHRKTKVTRDHKVVPYQQVQKGLYDCDIRENQNQACPEHRLVLISFCEPCEELACQQCCMEGHSGHTMCSLDVGLEKYRQQITGLQDSIHTRLPNIHQYVEFLTKYSVSMEESRNEMLASTEDQAKLLHTLIDQIKVKIHTQINENYDREQILVKSKIANLETASKSLSSNADYLTRLMRQGKAAEILSLRRGITHRLAQLLGMQLDGIEGKLQMSFTLGNSSEQNIGTLFGKLDKATVPLGRSELMLAEGSKTALKITTVLPKVRSKLEIVTSFDAEADCDDKDVWPTGIAISKTGDIVIVDRDNKKIKIFNENGRFKTEFTGKNEHRLGTPFDAAVLHNGNIAVTDYEREDVKVFSRIGDHVFTIKGHFKHPRGITTSDKGEIMVVDCRLQQVSYHDPKNGKLIQKIDGKNSAGSKVLVDPYYICTTHVGNVIVTDSAAPHIKVFSPEGTYLAQYGDYGNQEDQILQPFGACVDQYGYIFVADNHNHRVHLLQPDGTLSKFLLTKNDGLWHPMGVSISKSGYFVVTEALGKVRLYRYI